MVVVVVVVILTLTRIIKCVVTRTGSSHSGVKEYSREKTVKTKSGTRIYHS